MTLPFYDTGDKDPGYDGEYDFRHTSTNRGRRRALTGRVRQHEAIDSMLASRQAEVLARAEQDPKLFLNRCIGRAAASDVGPIIDVPTTEQYIHAVIAMLDYRAMFDVVINQGREMSR